MPKIIENLPQSLMAEARRQVLESGYSAMTIRSVAQACNVGIGTVYNYFPSKDALTAGFMAADWKTYIAQIQAAGEKAQEPEPVLRCIYDQLRRFLRLYQPLFQDATAIANAAGAFGHYHQMLRGQLAAPLRRFCAEDFQAEFIAEALLTWTVAGRPFEEIESQIQKIF